MTVYTKEIAKDLVNVFEDLLDEKGIAIPDEFRNGEENEAMIYGQTYDNILTNVECVVIELMEKLEIDYKADTWNIGKWIER